MHALVRPFVEICLLRRRPQDLPPSTFLLGLTLAAYTVLGVLASTLRLSAGEAVLAGVVDTATLAALTASVLAVHRHLPRLVQTLTALAGSGAVLTAVALPVIGWFEAAAREGMRPPFAELLVWMVVIWSFVVAAHVIRHALSSGFGAGIVVAVMFYLVSFSLQNALFDYG